MLKSRQISHVSSVIPNRTLEKGNKKGGDSLLNCFLDCFGLWNETNLGESYFHVKYFNETSHPSPKHVICNIWTNMG